jgi:hypothetical protein
LFSAREVNLVAILISRRTCDATMIKSLDVDPRCQRQRFIAANTKVGCGVCEAALAE